MTDRFRLRSALVTGASGDIGSAVARALVAEGALVTLVDRDVVAVSELAAELGASARAEPADVTSEAEVERAVATAAEFGRGLHLVFNNAGIEGAVGPLHELDLAELTRVLQVNVVGAAAVLKHTLPLLGPGSVVVQTASTAGLSGAPFVGPYVASKHALLGLTKVASREVAARGVRVVAICPGPVAGRMMQRIDSGRAAAGTPSGAARTPASTTLDDGRYATVDEVVGAVLFLLGPEAGFVSGSGLVLDGGRLA
ncbi:SDR family oxidoreductase [Pseudonocardia petroleophila]|uniref:SDR family oxidoreductase n=1 Tax=Pseudonocardia petroleophila TaxID=37331 RepID=A0A7G7MCB2_9PSEU|nr:SDR family oxidoreductase [Pseudonocardia petroleophila]QNG50423.1 SDR family oxidoreductase [Pseudonocardia petroleophila]